MMNAQGRISQDIEFVTQDGTRLAATRYSTQGAPSGRVLVAGATGVPQGFYARFATHAACAGYETLTFDYRGTGRSKRGSLKGFDASFLEWARQDLAGAVDSIPKDGVPLFLAAHSFGGHALGLLPRHARLAGAWICATGAGWAGWTTPAERVRLWALWNVIIPPLVRLKGYMPMSMFGMGEDLPLGVYRQWRRWCTFRHYFLDDPDAAELKAACETVRVPMLAMAALDDAWAPPASRDAFLLKAYPKAHIQCVEVDPRDHGGAIGHMGYFRRSASGLWDQALAWFADRVPQPQ